MAEPFRILVVCFGNTGQSPMAEALLLTRGAKRPRGVVVAESAGVKPGPKVSEYALQTLVPQGIKWGRNAPRNVSAVKDLPFDLVITLSDHAKAACPMFPQAKAQVHWGLPDPTEHVASATARAAYAACCTALVARVNALLRLPLEEYTAEQLRDEAQALHDLLASPERRTSARLWR